MGSHVPLQFVSVPAGVAAQAALEWTLSSVRANVAFQLADLKPQNTTKKKISYLKSSWQPSSSPRTEVITFSDLSRVNWWWGGGGGEEKEEQKIQSLHRNNLPLHI